VTGIPPASTTRHRTRAGWRLGARRGRIVLVLCALAGVLSPSPDAASPTFHASASSLGQSKTLTIARPAKLAPGDVMVAALAARTATETISPPPGWTLIRRDMSGNVGAELSQALYYHVSGSKEPSSYVWTFAPAVSANGAILAYGGVSRRRPIDAHSGLYTPDATSFAAPSVRTAASGDRVLAFFGSTGVNGITPPKGMAERFDLVGQDLGLEGATSLMAAAGATGVKRAADSAGGVNSSSFGQLVALRPACSGATGRPRVGQRPAILGSAYVGRRLTTYRGAWCGKRPLRFTYRWKRCGSSGCTTINGATSATYMPTKRDLDMSLTFTVTARSTAGTTTAKSSPKQVGRKRPTNTSPPTISGAAKEGFELTASTGTWTGLEPITYAYQWRRCDANGSACTSVPGATNSTYVPTSADVSATMRAVVTATNSSGWKSATSGQTPVVAPAASAATPPSNTALPTVSGSTSQGSTLNSSSGTWSGTAPISYAYQWQRCDTAGSNCSAVSGATASTYVLAPADVGSTLRLLVAASNSAGSTSAVSLPTAVVAATATPPLNTTPPTITGVAEVGSLLTASTGTWTGTTPIGYTYQWRRCDQAGANCVSISGATGSNYQVINVDGGSTLRVLVRAVNAVGSNVATSVQTGVVEGGLSITTTGALLGAMTTVPGTTGSTWSQQAVLDFEAQIGRKLDIDHQHRWASSTSPCSGDLFPSSDREYWDWSNGRYSLISWSPYANLDQILSGQFDSCIRDRAHRLAAFQNPIFVRMWWEMNLTWPMWSGYRNGANHTATQKFVSAWRYVVDMMRAEGATNVLWVWCPNAGDVPWDTDWNHWTSYYPGDNYVDWVAMDGYNWNSGYWGWDQFSDMFTRTNFGGSHGSSVYNDYVNRKPIMVAETASAEDPNIPGRKGDWMKNIAGDVPMKMPGLKALVYFNVHVSDPNTPDWRIWTSQSSVDGFRALAQSTFFHTR
jgi:hypothetical protein